MGKTSDPEGYIRETKQHIQNCFNHHILPMITFLMDYPLNTEEDARADVSFCNEIKEMCHATDTSMGFLPYILPFQIYYNSSFHRQLDELTKGGLEIAPFYPGFYHGIPVREELQYYVKRSSVSLSFEKVIEYEKQIQMSCVITDETHKILHRHLFLSLLPIVAKETKNNAYYLDKDKDVLHLRNVMKDEDNYLAEYPTHIMGTMIPENTLEGWDFRNE